MGIKQRDATQRLVQNALFDIHITLANIKGYFDYSHKTLVELEKAMDRGVTGWKTAQDELQEMQS